VGAKVDDSYSDGSLVIGVSMVASPPNSNGDRLITTIPCCSAIATYQCAAKVPIQTDRGVRMVHPFDSMGFLSPWAIYKYMCILGGWSGLSAGRMPEAVHIERMANYLDAKITCICIGYNKKEELCINMDPPLGKLRGYSVHVKIVLSGNHYITNNDGSGNLNLRRITLENHA
jgi:hypothetical protein